MNTIRLNPFDELKLSVNQKAIFQPFSHEAKSFDRGKSINLLAFFVQKGYDLHRVVLDYLISRVSLYDRCRINEIENAFTNYHILIDNKQRIKYGTKYCTKTKLNKIIEAYSHTLLEEENKKLKDEGDLIDVYKRLTEAIEGFIRKIQTNNYSTSISLRKLIIAFVEEDLATYSYLSKILDIDLNQDISEKIRLKDRDFESEIKNNKYIKSESIILWKEFGLYAFLKLSLWPDLKANRITYKHPSYNMPSTQYINTLIKKYYPKEDFERLDQDDIFRRERMLDFAERAVEILWIDNSFFNDPVYSTRCNYSVGDIANQYIPELYESNLISICIKDNNEEIDKKLYDNLLNGIVVKHDFKRNYIHRFFDIVNLIKEKDVLINSSYLGNYENKIGLIKKGSKIIELKKENLTLYCLQMKSVYCTPYPNFWGESNEIKTINLSIYPVLKSLIPQQVTISPIQKSKNKIYSIYYGYPIKIELTSMNNENIETMCEEWLRSKYVSEEFRIKFQLIRTGGNFADIDILGCNSNNEIIACQVTNTENKKLIKDKVQKLETFVSDKKIMFSHLETNRTTQESFNQNITEIWNTFEHDNVYINLLKRLIMN